ncbi:MAG TPA: sulfotransferase family protein, partial [Thermoanaerobaculia bacterium]|nr:sulfotransferase family protein [Thermoanaerobaculia bacterium]
MSPRANAEILRLSVWSGPRNVSTALMYSFAQRPDVRVVDEPLYAHYLRVTGAPHPGREVVLAGQDGHGQRVVEQVILGPSDRPVLFMKQMAHHLVDLDWSFLRRTANVLLVRDPAEVLTSLVKHLPNPQLRDTGFAVQSQLLEQLSAWGQPPLVIDAAEILLDPAGVLASLCERLGIPFDPSMLSWPPGPRAEDGVWAPYWYSEVHRSTGF